jgi:glycosyltransferase involved in cell wall biosynthesis
VAKILIVGPAHPLRGGLATFNERLALSFKEQGHECDILSFSLQYPSILFPGKSQFSVDAAPQNIKIFSNINSINPINWLLVGNKIAKAKYDIVIFRYWLSFMAPAFGTIARRIKTNGHSCIIAITDNLIPHEKRFFDNSLTRYFINTCDGFLTMSEAVKQQLISWNVKKPIMYTPHPMYDMFGAGIEKNEAKIKLGLETNCNYLLFFGFIRRYKGLHLLLDALHDERIRNRNLKVIIAGEFYEDAKPYLNQIAQLNLQDRVELRNEFIPNSEVATYFSAADAVIQPYTDATQSGVTQIAYYYNKPMIVTNVGGLAELVPHEKVGLVCDVSATSIASAIARFFDEKMEVTMQKNAAIEKQKFTWSTLTNCILKLAN